MMSRMTLSSNSTVRNPHVIDVNVMDDVILHSGRYPESFMLISLLEVCQEWGVKKGGTWRILRVSDRRHGGQGHP